MGLVFSNASIISPGSTWHDSSSAVFPGPLGQLNSCRVAFTQPHASQRTNKLLGTAFTVQPVHGVSTPAGKIKGSYFARSLRCHHCAILYCSVYSFLMFFMAVCKSCPENLECNKTYGPNSMHEYVVLTSKSKNVPFGHFNKALHLKRIWVEHKRVVCFKQFL